MVDSPATSSPNPKRRICVIGAGASGLAALRALKERSECKDGLWDVVAFEAREDIGGIWIPSPVETPGGEPPLSPLYDSLTTNLPHPVMSFRGVPFPPSTPLFPRADTVRMYLVAYAREFDLVKHVQFNTSVLSVNWDCVSETWIVRTRTRSSAPRPEVGTEDAEASHTFTHLIVANGHYHIPYYPTSALPGLSAWLSLSPPRVTHSTYYRSPAALGDIGHTVLVIGGGPSGRDVAEELHAADVETARERGETPRRTIVHAAGVESTDEDGGTMRPRGRVVRLDAPDAPEGGTAYFADGTSERGITHVILATGYLLSHPFLTSLPTSSSPSLPPVAVCAMPPPPPPLPARLHDSGHHLFPLAREMFPLVEDPPVGRLAVLGLPVKVVPFPLAEAQARAAAHLIAHPGALDQQAEREAVLRRYNFLRKEADAVRDWERDEDRKELYVAHSWHRSRGHEQFEYRDAMHALAGLTGPEWEARAWEVELYDAKDVLRRLWRAVEARGESEKWVGGVGEGKAGEEAENDWVRVMRRLLESEVIPSGVEVTSI